MPGQRNKSRLGEPHGPTACANKWKMMDMEKLTMRNGPVPLLARHRFAAVACARCLQTKYVLSNYDNKRYWYSDFESLPFGHYAIKYLHNEKMI